LHCIRIALGCIFEQGRIIETCVIAMLADSKQYANTLLMVFFYCIYKHVTAQVTPTAGRIAQAHPGDASIGNFRVTIYTQNIGGLLYRKQGRLRCR